MTCMIECGHTHHAAHTWLSLVPLWLPSSGAWYW